MDLGLKGKSAIVLGGTRGIGRAIAATLAGEGANVAVCARNAEQVAATVAELKASGIRATGGLGRRDRRRGAEILDRRASASELGGVDMLFSNAGAMAQGGDPASWEQNFRLDVLGAVHAFEAARPFLEASGERSGDAAFVIISSISAAQADTGQLLRPDQGGADPHGQGTGAAIREEEDPRQRGLARHRLFQGRRLEDDREEHAEALQGCDEPQPDRPHGDAAGNRERGGVPGEPGVGVHHGIESRRGWRDLEPGEF